MQIVHLCKANVYANLNVPSFKKYYANCLIMQNVYLGKPFDHAKRFQIGQ